VVAVLAGRNLKETLASTWAERKDLTAGERGGIQDLSYGAVRFRGQLEAIRSQFIAKPTGERSLDALILVALFQLIYSKAPPYAIVANAVNAARVVCRRPWAAGLANGVLRSFIRRQSQALSAAQGTDEARYSYPNWWIERVRASYPSEWQRVLQAGNQRPPLTLRVNRRKTSVEEYQRRLNQEGIFSCAVGGSALMLNIPRSVDTIPGFADGLVSVQDMGAQRAAPTLDLHDGMRVLDACAGPGGKTGHLAEIADLDLVAIERDPARAERINTTLDRLSRRATVLVEDACALTAWWDGKPFDRILIDAPCSASGVVKRHPDIKWVRRPQDLESFATQQERLLEALWQVLGNGGKLLYVTCSVFPEENQDRIAALRVRQPNAIDLPIADAAPSGWQILPDDLSDGFFYALLEKR
jgi:16S rRNA (cytosine967-C5)-methyltransferase